MRLRFRLILSYLFLAMVSIAFLLIQANMLFTRQVKSLNDSAGQALEMVNGGTIESGEIVQILRENQTKSNQIIESIRFEVVSLTSILLVVLAGLGIWFAIKFSAPFERNAESANSLFKLVQNSIEIKDDLNAGNVETMAGISLISDLKLEKEEHLISHTLDYVSAFVKDEIPILIKDLDQRMDEKKMLSDQLVELRELIHEMTEAFDTKLMLDEITQRIFKQFKAKFVGIYLMDEGRQFVELRAACVDNSQEGDWFKESSQQNIEKKVRFLVNEIEKSGEGMVGQAAATGEIYQSDDKIQFPQILEDSKITSESPEIALPIHARGVVMGVLDMVSISQELISPDGLAILKMYADQVALVTELDKLLEVKASGVERNTYGDITRQAWDELVLNRSEWGYRSDEKGIFKSEGEWLPWMVQAVQQGQVVVWQDDDFSIASVPIRVRDYTLGVLDFRKEGGTLWTSDELILVQTLTDQLGQALESARLYQSTQVRAERERVLTDITSKVRASTNVDVILQTAIRELAEALRVPKGSIQLRSYGGEIKERHNPPTSGGQGNA